MIPNGPSLVATCGPLLQAPWLALFFTRSTQVISYSPLAPMGCHPETLPRHSTFTSKKPLAVLRRVMLRLVVMYVGSVKKTYLDRNCAGGRMFTNSSSPMHGLSCPPVTKHPVISWPT